MRTLSDTQLRILREEYPAMSIENDSDIERYFDMRKQGRQADALALYNNKLRKKYPDDSLRERLLGYYRAKDPRFVLLHHDCLAALAERLVARTMYIIDLLTKDIDAIDMTDAYPVIKLCEGLLSIISPDRYEAIAFTEKYARYAKLLAHRESPMERTAELIRLYVTDTIESVQDLKRKHEEKRSLSARARVQAKKQAPGFDLSRIVFSPQDIQKILIPEGITRTEDVVVAYCLKYWNCAFDSSFEKTVILYSRKNHTKHADIYQAIRNGREHHWKDEEILNAVLASVVSGYYYSISGDLYLQRTWARYKDSVQAGIIPAHAEAQQEKTIALPRRSKPVQTRQIIKPGKSPKKAVPKAKKPYSAAKKIAPFKSETPERKRGTVAVPPPPARTFKPNSVADIIRANTGKTYTVYQELFFRGVRPSIRNVLSLARAGKNKIFDSKQNEAEELIYNFLYDHYNNPYQNWKESEAKKKLETLGYMVAEIETVIVRWIRDSEG